MALSQKSSLTHPIEINLTSGSSSGVAILIGSGSPDGNTDPWSSAGKSSLHFRIDATDDYPALYQKVDDDGSDDDWVTLLAEKSEMDHTLEGDLTLDSDKRVYFRDTNTSIYSDSACKLYVDAASGVDVSRLTVGTGTYFNSFLAGSGTIEYGALDSGATSTACLAVTGLTQEHKVFISASQITTPCLVLNGYCCSPGGGLLQMTVANAASESNAAGSVIFGYMAVAACG